MAGPIAAKAPCSKYGQPIRARNGGKYPLRCEDGQRDAAAILPKANFEAVTPGYFDAVGTALIAGRDFDLHDSKETGKVVIISQAIASHFRKSGRDPLGQRLTVFGEVRQVIGVVADARFRGVRQPGQDVYVPNSQIDVPASYLIVRGTLPSAELLSLVRRTIKETAPAQAMASEATIGQLIDRNTARDRFNLALLLLFAAGAIVLAAAGFHSVTRESVAVRAKEIAIRIAVGADRGRLAAQTIGGIVSYVCGGALAGACLTIWFAGRLEDLLYAVSPRDPAILFCVTASVIVTAAVSSFLPAWKAAGRDPRGQLLSD